MQVAQVRHHAVRQAVVPRVAVLPLRPPTTAAARPFCCSRGREAPLQASVLLCVLQVVHARLRGALHVPETVRHL